MDVEALDVSKENIQPLRRGRNISVLGTALMAQTDSEVHQQLMRERDQYEKLIRSYEGDDPLTPWYDYVQWVEQNFPKHGKEGNLRKVLEKCLAEFRNSKLYAQDVRYIDLWTRFMGFADDPLDIYRRMHAHELGTQCAIFYECWAEEYEKADDLKRANQIYMEGIARKAQPIEDLLAAHNDFQVRVARRVLADGPQSEESKGPEKRSALSVLRAHGRKRNAVNAVRVGHSIKRSTPGVLCAVDNSANSEKNCGRNVKLSVYSDENGSCNDAVAKPKSKAGIMVSQRDVNKENEKKAGRWNEGKFKQKNPVSGTGSFNWLHSGRVPAFHVHEDEASDIPKTPQSDIMASNILKSRSYMSEEESSVPVAIFEPLCQKKMPVYPKSKVYSGSTEFSLEELRALMYMQREAKERARKLKHKEHTSFSESVHLVPDAGTVSSNDSQPQESQYPNDGHGSMHDPSYLNSGLGDQPPFEVYVEKDEDRVTLITVKQVNTEAEMKPEKVVPKAAKISSELPIANYLKVTKIIHSRKDTIICTENQDNSTQVQQDQSLTVHTKEAWHMMEGLFTSPAASSKHTRVSGKPKPCTVTSNNVRPGKTSQSSYKECTVNLFSDSVANEYTEKNEPSESEGLETSHVSSSKSTATVTSGKTLYSGRNSNIKELSFRTSSRSSRNTLVVDMEDDFLPDGNGIADSDASHVKDSGRASAQSSKETTYNLENVSRSDMRNRKPDLSGQAHRKEGSAFNIYCDTETEELSCPAMKKVTSSSSAYPDVDVGKTSYRQYTKNGQASHKGTSEERESNKFFDHSQEMDPASTAFEIFCDTVDEEFEFCGQRDKRETDVEVLDKKTEIQAPDFCPNHAWNADKYKVHSQNVIEDDCDEETENQKFLGYKSKQEKMSKYNVGKYDGVQSKKQDDVESGSGDIPSSDIHLSIPSQEEYNIPFIPSPGMNPFEIQSLEGTEEKENGEYRKNSSCRSLAGILEESRNIPFLPVENKEKKIEASDDTCCTAAFSIPLISSTPYYPTELKMNTLQASQSTEPDDTITTFPRNPYLDPAQPPPVDTNEFMVSEPGRKSKLPIESFAREDAGIFQRTSGIQSQGYEDNRVHYQASTYLANPVQLSVIQEESVSGTGRDSDSDRRSVSLQKNVDMGNVTSFQRKNLFSGKCGKYKELSNYQTEELYCKFFSGCFRRRFLETINFPSSVQRFYDRIYLQFTMPSTLKCENDTYLVFESVKKSRDIEIFRTFTTASSSVLLLEVHNDTDPWDFYIRAALASRSREKVILESHFAYVKMGLFYDDRKVLISNVYLQLPLSTIIGQYCKRKSESVREMDVIWLASAVLKIVHYLHKWKFVHGTLTWHSFSVRKVPDTPYSIILTDFKTAIDVNSISVEIQSMLYQMDYHGLAVMINSLISDVDVERGMTGSEVVSNLPKNFEKDLWMMIFSELLDKDEPDLCKILDSLPILDEIATPLKTYTSSCL